MVYNIIVEENDKTNWRGHFEMVVWRQPLKGYLAITKIKTLLGRLKVFLLYEQINIQL